VPRVGVILGVATRNRSVPEPVGGAVALVALVRPRSICRRPVVRRTMAAS
jgi:hypothetical protein